MTRNVRKENMFGYLSMVVHLLQNEVGKKTFFCKNICVFTKYTFFCRKNVFIWKKNFYNVKIFLWKKTFFTEKNYISLQKYIFTQKIFLLQIKYESFLNIYSFCKKNFFDHKKYIR